MAMNLELEFAGERFSVTVARRYAQAREWIQEVERDNAAELIRKELLAGIAVQWRRRNLSADVLQICVGRKVLIVQMRFFHLLPKPLLAFLALKSGVTFYGLGVSRYGEKLRKRRVKTAFIVDVRNSSVHTGEKLSGASYGRLFELARISDGDAVASLEDYRTVVSDWGRIELVNDQIIQAALRAIVPVKLAQLLR